MLTGVYFAPVIMLTILFANEGGSLLAVSGGNCRAAALLALTNTRVKLL
jgi:hypothetical protein